MAAIPMLSVGETRSGRVSLQELYDRGEHHTLLNASLRLLANNPDNAEAVFFAVRSYVAIGLIGPALKVLRQGGQPLGSMPEFAGLHSQLAAMPSGRVPWSSLQQRFDSNTSKIYQMHPELQCHDAAFRAIPQALDLYRTLDGTMQLSERVSEGQRRWRPCLVDAKRMAAGYKLAHDPGQLFCAPYVILGDHFGTLFGKVFDGTRKMFLTFTPRIYLLEPDVGVFGAMLYAAESVDDLCNDRVTILIGAECVEALLELLRREPSRAIPGFVVGLPSSDQALRGRLVKAIRELAADRERSGHATIASMRKRYEARPVDYWAERFTAGRGEKLRILGMTSRFTTVLQYSMRDLKAAFERLGHDFRLLIEESDHDLLPPVHIAEAIEEFNPDMIFTIDHLRREYAQVIPENVPFICWIQDQLPHLVRPEAGRSQGLLDFIVAGEIEPLARKYGYPASQGMIWTMATDDRLYSNEPLSDAALEPYRCDFSFVSNQSQLPLDLHHQRQGLLGNDPGMMRITEFLFDALSEQIASDPEAACGTSATLINRAKRETGVAPAGAAAEDALARVYLQPLTDLMFRQSALEWVADYCDRTGRTLHLYGNGWESHPRFAKYARGVAKNGRELRGIHQASRINLQITCYGAIHQRLLDGLAAGGFFLIRYCPTDAIGEPLRQLLAAFKKYGCRLDIEYASGDVPDLAAAMTALADLYHEERPGPIISLPAWKLDHYRSFAAAGYRRVAGEVFDRYHEVAFKSAEDLVALADRYLEDEQQRKAIAASMHDAVVQRFTYAALVNDLLSFIGDRLRRTGGPPGGP
ncbi:MAG TPA: glycosyltransferase [Phycisphaerae bacterium]|nr:glycosyltransferase [Phycisphaerae bacterium]